MKKDINLSSVNKFKNNIIEKCNSLVSKITINVNISNITKFLNLNINNSGINLISDSKNKKTIADCLSTCSQVIVSASTKNVLSSVLSAINSIKDLQTLKNACKTINQLVNKSIILKPNESDIKSILEPLVISLIQYVYQVLYLEYSHFYHYYLFPEGNPEYNDIQQGSIKDCYLLAALSSLCKSSEGKKAIKKCFTNRETIDIDNFVVISLFKVKLDIENKKRPFAIDNDGHAHGGKLGQALKRVKAEENGNIKIKVDKDSIKTSFAQGKALWVKFFEKAFETYRMANNVTASLNNETIKSYIRNWNNKIDGKILDEGTSDIVITAITGKTSHSIALQNNTDRPILDKYSPNELAIYNTIKKKLAKGLAVTAGMKGKAENENHMYSVVGAKEVQNGNLIIELYNPHGKFQFFFIDEFIRKFEILNVESSKR